MSNRCAACGKTVYLGERAAGKGNDVFHKVCFRCSRCNSLLRPGNFSVINGVYYCIPHYTQLFKEHGNYDEGFTAAAPPVKPSATSSASNTDGGCSAAGVGCTWRGPQAQQAAHARTCPFVVLLPALLPMAARIGALEEKVEQLETKLRTYEGEDGADDRDSEEERREMEEDEKEIKERVRERMKEQERKRNEELERLQRERESLEEEERAAEERERQQSERLAQEREQLLREEQQDREEMERRTRELEQMRLLRRKLEEEDNDV
eukprot:TRINITY_DN1057_c0_g4_i2.p1 TRINITY_DN1057_c0_g4~~TRINITY_DN1057_c0_g4_i2.p1  ORF type:complete len:265 (-),score=98.88 TRINITY_DN1057_c0_g4_i2:404-1198(-)